ncbi:MFS transporter [Neobacillus sp. OS1-32]|uniref:MFS transporter n=1 Tax=Neobacillus sp. OS1-32 TaxID=3070682 RepID=UPI0027E15A3C|nr:MFS transporter [Neobacillus sp. OS1-32]WML31771.1 MFS transporter [Neobacillus sp. OS1-32]
MTGKIPKLWTKSFIFIVFTTFLFFFDLHMLNAGFPIFITQMKSSPILGGTMTTAFMFAAIVTRPFISVFLPKLEIKKSIIYTLIGIFGCISFSINNYSIPILISLRVLPGIGFGIITTLLATLATTIIPKKRLGEGIGFFGMATSLGASLAPAATIAIFHSFSFLYVLLFSLIVELLIFGCFLSMQTKPSYTLMPETVPISRKEAMIDYIFDKKILLPSILVFFYA